MGRQASFDFIVIKSAKEKSRENNKQTARKRSRRKRVKNFKEKKRVRARKMSTKFAAWRSVLVKQFDYGW